MAAKFSKKEALKFGFETFKKNWKFLVVVFLAVWILESIITSFTQSLAGKSEGLKFFYKLVSSVFDSFFMLGIYKISLTLVEGKKATFRLLYEQYPKFVNYLIGTILYMLMVIGGLILFIVPGIILGIKYGFYMYEIIDKNKSPMDAFKASSKITAGSKMNLFLFHLINIGIVILGAVVFGVGLLVALPIVFLSVAHVYRKLAS